MMLGLVVDALQKRVGHKGGSKKSEIKTKM